MKKNLGLIDRVIRVLVLATALVLFFTGTVEGTLVYILIAVGGILAATAFINFCPIYAALGLRSNKG